MIRKAAAHKPILGIAGKYCAGKNTASEYFTQQNWKLLDVDALGHQALITLKDDIITVFGQDILHYDGNIDRKMLGNIIFKRKAYRKRLENIVHPWMQQQIEKNIRDFYQKEKAQPQYNGLLINAALLFYMRLDKFCSTVLLIRASLCRRIYRAYRRDSLPLWKIIQRIQAQNSINAQARYSPAEVIIIDNSKDSEQLYAALSALQCL